MINVDAVWTKLQELWAGSDHVLVVAVAVALLGNWTSFAIFRKTRRHELQLEDARRGQDRREGVYRDLLTLIDPVSHWLHESRNYDAQGDAPSPPKLDDNLQVKVNVGMNLDNQLNKSILNTSSWWWPEWMDAYKNVLRLAGENESVPPIPLMRLENAEIRLRRSFDSDRSSVDILLDLKWMYLHGVMFLNESTIYSQLVDIFERVVERSRAFRLRFAERAEIRTGDGGAGMGRQPVHSPYAGRARLARSSGGAV